MKAEKLRKEFGGKIVLWGGLDVQYVLPYGTVEEVEAEVRRIIEIFAPGGGYVFSPAHVIQPDVPLENIFVSPAHVIQPDVPLEDIFAMWDAVEKYSRYPI